MKNCSVTGCDRPFYGRSFCRMHYLRWYRHGDPLRERRAGSEWQHGTLSGYAAHKCRCTDCSLAGWEYRRAKRGTKSESPFRQPRKCEDCGAERTRGSRYYCAFHTKNTVCKDCAKPIVVELRRRKGNACADCLKDRHRERNRAQSADRVREYNRRYEHKNRTRINLRAANKRAMKRGSSPENLEYADILYKDPCSYCGSPGGEIDHISPLNSGGAHDWSNFTAACRSCNASKNDKPLMVWLIGRHVAHDAEAKAT